MTGQAKAFIVIDVMLFIGFILILQSWALVALIALGYFNGVMTGRVL